MEGSIKLLEVASHIPSDTATVFGKGFDLSNNKGITLIQQYWVGSFIA